MFQNLSSWLGFNRTNVSISTKKQEIEDVIGDLEVPDYVLFGVETDAQVRLKPSHELRF